MAGLSSVGLIDEPPKRLGIARAATSLQYRDEHGIMTADERSGDAVTIDRPRVPWSPEIARFGVIQKPIQLLHIVQCQYGTTLARRAAGRRAASTDNPASACAPPL